MDGREEELLATIQALERRLASLRRSRQTLLRLLIIRERAEGLRRLWGKRLAGAEPTRVISLDRSNLPPSGKA